MKNEMSFYMVVGAVGGDASVTLPINVPAVITGIQLGAYVNISGAAPTDASPVIALVKGTATSWTTGSNNVLSQIALSGQKKSDTANLDSLFLESWKSCRFALSPREPLTLAVIGGSGYTTNAFAIVQIIL